MKNPKVLSMLILIFGTISLVSAFSLHHSDSVWDSVLREKREAEVVPSSSEPNAKAENEPEAEAEPQDKCETGIEDLKPKCKEDACPLDDVTVQKCCNCLKTCCSSEDESSHSTENSMSNSTSSSNSTKPNNGNSKIKETAQKVEGFFKNVGNSIKGGVNTGWDKVKGTANDVKESVRKGINKSAEWVKNHTDSEKKNDCTGKDSNCTMSDSTSSPSDQTTEQSSDKEDSNESKKTKRSPSSESESSNDNESTTRKSSKLNDKINEGVKNVKEKISSSFSSKGKHNNNSSKKDENTDSKSASEESESSSDSTTSSGSSTPKTPVPGMRKSRSLEQRQEYGEAHYYNNRPIWSSPSGNPVSSDVHTQTTNTSVSSSSVGRYRRDIPPGMMAKRKTTSSPMMQETTANSDSQRSKRDTDNDKFITTPSSASQLNDRDGSKGMQRSKNQKRETEDEEENCTNSSHKHQTKKSKRSPAGPPANSKTMVTTTLNPSSGKDCQNSKEMKDPADEDKKHRRRRDAEAESSTTGAMDDNSNSTSESTPNINMKLSKADKEGSAKISIIVTTNTSKKDQALVPIRAPGSINPDDISQTYANNSNSTANNGTFERDPNLFATILPPDGIASGSALLSNTDPSVPKIKPGKCRPLSQGLQCVTLGRDASQCRDDSACEGTKKCCFYSCAPNSDIGICEHPIFS